MLKQQPMISEKQAEKLIYTMAKYSDHPHQIIRNFLNVDIKRWFEQNHQPWKRLIADTRSSNNPIPFVENLFDYEWKLSVPDNSSTTVYQYGHKTVSLTGSGQLSILDYHTKFKQALEARTNTIKKGSYSDLLSCITHSVASVESYITSKTNIWNKTNNQQLFPIESIVDLDKKLNDWLYSMVGYKLNQEGKIWNHFTDFRNLNNTIFKHNTIGSHAATYSDMAKLINKFKTGIAELLFKLHLLFKESVPSKIIRGIYLPDVFNVK